MSIPLGKGLLSRIGRDRPGRPWPEPKSVRDIQVFIRLLLTFHFKVEDHCTTHPDALDELINGLINSCGPDYG